MLERKGFDKWADRYDRDVGLSDIRNSYPFAGYGKVLDAVENLVEDKGYKSVLDLGFGTGELTARLYDKGCTVAGQDFSPEMVKTAQAKMPDALLVCGDIAKGLASSLQQKTYDAVIMTYFIHHLSDARKHELLKDLQGRLNEGGMIIIGDVAFETRQDLEDCRTFEGGAWDDEEVYIAADELKQVFPDLVFTKMSYCAGLITIGK